MATGTTPFSFHCMICFEEFSAHPEGRYPVVLPCGHTYVCQCCAERLDKCMECRVPLYSVAPTQQKALQPNHQNQNRGTAWGRMEPSRPTQPPPPVKKRVPLPKNVVLLSLIEATELATESVHKKFQTSSASEDSVGPLMPQSTSEEDMEELEEEKIKVSTSYATGMAGTYAVAVKEGLEIFQHRPPVTDSSSNVSAADEDVDTLVQFHHKEETSVEPSPSRLRLQFGDRVQVVSLEGSWAKLARGYGFVRSTGNALVKGTWDG